MDFCTGILVQPGWMNNIDLQIKAAIDVKSILIIELCLFKNLIWQNNHLRPLKWYRKYSCTGIFHVQSGKIATSHHKADLFPASIDVRCSIHYFHSKCYLLQHYRIRRDIDFAILHFLWTHWPLCEWHYCELKFEICMLGFQSFHSWKKNDLTFI